MRRRANRKHRTQPPSHTRWWPTCMCFNFATTT
jgi:hypothetical protein